MYITIVIGGEEYAAMLQQFYLRLKLLVDWDLIGLHVPVSSVAGMVLFQQR